VSETKIANWFNYKVRVWKHTSGSDCKSESKNRNYKPRRFKSHELIVLNRIFEYDHYPNGNIKNDLAQRMGISKVKIHRWFMNKRYLERHVSSSTSVGDGYVNFINSSTGNINYPSASFHFPAKTMPPDHSHRHPQFQSQPDFCAAFSAGVCVCVCVCVCVRARARVCACVRACV